MKQNYRRQIRDERRRRLQELCDQYGSQRKVADYAGLSTSQLNHILRDVKGMGETVARRIEENLNLEHGYLLEPFGHEHSALLLRRSQINDRVVNITHHNPDADGEPLLTFADIGNTEHINNQSDSCDVRGRSRVDGNSMTVTGTDGYPHGSIIYWETAIQAQTGDTVIAELLDGRRILRELDHDSTQPVLRAINPQYPIISDSFVVIAVVTGVFRVVRNVPLEPTA